MSRAGFKPLTCVFCLRYMGRMAGALSPGLLILCPPFLGHRALGPWVVLSITIWQPAWPLPAPHSTLEPCCDCAIQ